MSWLLPPLEPHFDAALRDVTAQGMEARVAAARRLARPDNERRLDEARAGLRRLLDDPAAAVRAAALDSLSNIGASDDHSRALSLLDDSHALVREWAVIALAAIEHPERNAELRNALNHPAPEVRFQALQACTQHSAETVTADALALSRDDDPKVREAAARALGAEPDPSGPAHARLRALLSDPVPEVAWESAIALSPLEVDAALPMLVAGLQQPARVLDSLDGLAHYSNAQARTIVAQLAQSWFKSPLVVAAAGRALLAMGDRQSGVAALRRALRALRSDGRNHALETVARAQVNELGAELRGLARFPRGADGELLVDALGAIAKDSPAARAGLTILARRRSPWSTTAAAVLARLTSRTASHDDAPSDTKKPILP